MTQLVRVHFTQHHSLKDDLTRYDDRSTTGEHQEEQRETSEPATQDNKQWKEKMSSKLRLINVDARAVKDVAVHH